MPRNALTMPGQYEQQQDPILFPMVFDRIMPNLTFLVVTDKCKENDNNNNKEAVFGRPRIPYSQQKDKHKLRLKAWETLLELSRGSGESSEAEAERLVCDIIKVYLPKIHEQLYSFAYLSQNIESMFKIFKEEIRDSEVGVQLAAVATQNLKTADAKKLTGYSKTSLAKGKKKVATRTKGIQKPRNLRNKYEH